MFFISLLVVLGLWWFVTYTWIEVCTARRRTLHTGTCRSNLFHEGGVIAALYLCFCLAALRSSRHVKWSKNKVKGEWHPSGEAPGSYGHPKPLCVYVCVSMCAQTVLLWPLSSNALMLNLTNSGLFCRACPSTRSECLCLAVGLYSTKCWHREESKPFNQHVALTYIHSNMVSVVLNTSALHCHSRRAFRSAVDNQPKPHPESHAVHLAYT